MSPNRSPSASRTASPAWSWSGHHAACWDARRLPTRWSGSSTRSTEPGWNARWSGSSLPRRAGLDLQDRVDDGVRAPAHVWRQALTGLHDGAPPDRGRHDRRTTLIIWGRDKLLPWEDARALAAIPGSRLVVYQDTGHLVLWEQPDRVASDLAEFVDSLPS